MKHQEKIKKLKKQGKRRENNNFKTTNNKFKAEERQYGEFKFIEKDPVNKNIKQADCNPIKEEYAYEIKHEYESDEDHYW